MPGDFVAAVAADLGTSAGDGNGLIEDGEVCAVFTHLQKAGFMQGDFIAGSDTSNNCTPASNLENQFSGRYQLSNSFTGANTQANAMTLLLGDQIPVSQLAEIDRKLDDGNALQGSVQVLAGEETLCATEQGNWNEAQGGSCAALYVIR